MEHDMEAGFLQRLIGILYYRGEEADSSYEAREDLQTVLQLGRATERALRTQVTMRTRTATTTISLMMIRLPALSQHRRFWLSP